MCMKHFRFKPLNSHYGDKCMDPAKAQTLAYIS